MGALYNRRRSIRRAAEHLLRTNSPTGALSWWTGSSPLMPDSLDDVIQDLFFRKMPGYIREIDYKIFNRGIFGIFFSSCLYYIQHCFICRPSDFTVSENAGIEPRTRIFMTSLAAVQRSLGETRIGRRRHFRYRRRRLCTAVPLPGSQQPPWLLILTLLWEADLPRQVL